MATTDPDIDMDNMDDMGDMDDMDNMEDLEDMEDTDDMDDTDMEAETESSSGSPALEHLESPVNQDPSQAGQRRPGAPIYSIPVQLVGAVECPVIVQNLDRAEKAFGRVSMDWKQVSPPISRVPSGATPRSR